MKLLRFLLILALPVVLIMGCQKMDPVQDVQDENVTLKSAITGNGAPSGAHYNLNIIGVPKGKKATMDNNDGHRIFVPLDGKAKIFLMEGDFFDVLDANGTDTNGATFQLPNPVGDEGAEYYESQATTVYSVWARPVGTPGGKSLLTTCALWDDPATTLVEAEVVCNLGDDVAVFERKNGQSSFTNVTKELLFIVIREDLDLNEDGIPDLNAGLYPIFSDALYGYYWDYDNDGLKVLQLRFYELPTTVTM